MAFALQNQIFDKIDHIWVDGEEIANSKTPNPSIEITFESKDIIDENECIIKRIWGKALYTIAGDKCCSIKVDKAGENHLLCATGSGWRYRPNKKKRIAKKWAKKYGKCYGYCSVNEFIRGTVEME